MPRKKNADSTGGAKRSVVPKEVLVIAGPLDGGVVKIFRQIEKPEKNEAGETVYVSAKKQAMAYANGPEAPEGPFRFFIGNEKRTKQTL